MNITDKILKLQQYDKEISVLAKEIEALQEPRMELIQELIADLNHDHNGEKTHEVEEFKLTIKTPINYSLNTKAFEKIKDKVPEEYNPVSESIKYTVSKTKFEYFLENAPKRVKNLFFNDKVKIIVGKPGKQDIKIGYVK